MKPRVVVAKQANAVRLYAVDAAAQALGLHPGLSLADARARHPGIDVAEADPAADQALLEALAEVCRRYTPVVALDGRDGLTLDVSGCAHLWGGEAGLLDDLAGRLGRLGFSLRAAVADTIGLAWAAARFTPGGVVPEGEREGPLSPMPCTALRLESDTAQALARVGLKTVGQLIDRPRAPLARRFGPEVLERLDQALGLRGEALTPEREIPPWRAERRLVEPISSEEAVLAVARDLAADLAKRLEAEGKGGRRFGLELFRVDGAVKRLEVAASRPLRDRARIVALFTERISVLNEGLEADYGFDLLRLWALKTETQAVEAPTLSTSDGAASDQTEELEALADRLAVRLGPHAVTKARPRDRWTPERAVAMPPWGEPEPKGAPAWADERPAAFDGALLRPLRLFRRPEPVDAVAEAPDGPPLRFTWRRLARRVARAEGPERISGDWRTYGVETPARDYWRVEDEGGRRYWLFRQGFWGEAEAPRWFVHGLFP